MCHASDEESLATLEWSENFRGLYEREPESFGETFDGYLRTCVHEDDPYQGGICYVGDQPANA